MIPELNGGFEYNCDDDLPLIYTEPVPGEGNYLVEVLFTSSAKTEDIYLFLNRRKLCFRGFGNGTEQIHYAEGVVNVCPTIPRGYTEVMESNNINITLIGKALNILSVHVLLWRGRTVHIAGDSSVTDQTAGYPYYPAGCYCGWGQMLPYFLKNNFSVSNYAHSGLTTESFRTGRYYSLMSERVKKNDICLFQFGHNDQKLPRLKASAGYRDNLCRYVEEMLKLEAVPVIVTPISRNGWRAGGIYNDLLGEYNEAGKEAAAELGINIINLHDITASFVKSNGMEKTKEYYFPSDFTHTNDYGGYLYASYVYEEMIRCGLCKREKYPSWVPKKNELKTLPPKLRPRNSLPEDFFDRIERGDDMITRAECFELAAAAMRFSGTNVYNDMFSDVVGHETYAGIIETAYENGFIPAGMVADGKIHPEDKASGEEFLTVLLTALSCRKPLELSDKTILESACSLGLLPQNFEAEQPLKRSDAAKMCKKVHL